MPFDIETTSKITGLRTLRRAGSLIPFIGSGFSTNINGFPTWSNFITLLQNRIKRELYMNLDLRDIFKDNWMDIAEYFYWLMGSIKNTVEPMVEGKKIFHELLKTEFDGSYMTTVTDKEWKQHIDLVDKFKKIYTTNWDKCLEYAAFYKTDGWKTKTSKIKSRIPIETEKFKPGITTRPNYVKIIKYHGCYGSHVDTIVASESDYYCRLKHLNSNPLDKLFYNDLLSNHFIFIGYKLEDMNVLYFLNQIKVLRPKTPTSSSFIWVVTLENRANINKTMYDFYNSHKYICFLPILTDDEQLKVKRARKEKTKQLIYKTKIIEFIDSI